MLSPFPGMDPYLEGYLWPDVQNALANKIRQQLMPKLRPHYVARLEIYVVEDENPEVEIGIMYPDLEVVAVKERTTRERGSAKAEASESLVPPLILPLLEPVPVRLPTVEIRDVARNELVTSIEILSPLNKREPGLGKYRQKRQRLQEANVHLLEIDLLRRGQRPLSHPRLPDSPYLVTLVRAGSRQVEVWPVYLQDSLPVVPVPLRAPKPYVALELGTALQAIYDEAAYKLSLDYSQPPPPPPLSAEAEAWLRQLLAEKKS
ncbi:MAG TPA: DUF4058 family protein [Anaerolineae bacterium]